MKRSPAAANVVLARARALYGRALKQPHYDALLGCFTVSDIVGYLKRETPYAALLKDVDETGIHRAYLEALLRRGYWDGYHALLRSAAALTAGHAAFGVSVLRYLVRREEVEQLLLYLRMMNAGHTEGYYFELPPHLRPYASLDPVAISRTARFDELLALLADTPYGRLLAPFRDAPEGGLPFTQIENALQTHLIRQLLDVVAHTGGELRGELQSLFGAELEAENVARIIRLKTYFRAGEEAIRANLLPAGGRLPPKKLDALLAAADADAVMALYAATPGGKRLPDARYTYDLPRRAAFYAARHHIHFSVHPIVTLLSYEILARAELDNLVHIIEGVRYRLPPEQIRALLVS